jgi:hypothetical protein
MRNSQKNSLLICCPKQITLICIHILEAITAPHICCQKQVHTFSGFLGNKKFQSHHFFSKGKKLSCSATQLKIFALLSMIIDHIAWSFLPDECLFSRNFLSLLSFFLHGIGHLAMPLMCFFIAEGFRHTVSKKNYLIRLGIFALVSEPAFLYFKTGSLLDFSVGFDAIYTLFFCLLALCALHTSFGFPVQKEIAIGCLLLSLLGDWPVFAVLWTLSFFYFFSDKRKCRSLFFTTTLALILFQGISYSLTHSGNNSGILSYFSIFLVWPILLTYDGKLTHGSTTHTSEKTSIPGLVMHDLTRWFFYWFYPLHLFLLGLLRWVIS